jgi:hypothetical protein
MRHLIRQVYRKRYDKSTKKYYYYNTKTKQSYWEKPVFFGKDDLNLTARTAAQVGEPFVEHHTPRFTAKDLTPEEAAIHLQGVWRARVARRKMRHMIRQVYRKRYDENTKKFYYYNTKTKKSYWEKPVFFGKDDLHLTARTAAQVGEPFVEHHTPRFTATDLTPDEAATHLQAMWRRRTARIRLRKIASGKFKKGFDPASKKFFYVNTQTNEAVWEKPKVLGTVKLTLTPRSELAAIKAGVAVAKAKPKTPRFKAADLTEEEAALHVQQCWRAKRARKKMRAMIAGVYQKKFDADSKTFYYYNKNTGQSFWQKPKGLGKSDINVTSRTEASALASGVEAGHIKQTPRFRARDISDEEAAKHIQGMWRRRTARIRLRKMASKVYTKSFDKASGTFYYTNEKTGESVWEKPKSLGRVDLKLTPRSERAAIKAGVELAKAKPKTPRFTATDLTPEEAAIHIQGMWRSRQARKRIASIAKHQYTKHYSAKNKAFYYTNKNTGVSVWEKPKVLGTDESDALELSARSKFSAKQDGNDVDKLAKKHTPRFHAADLSEAQAALFVQKCWRGNVARRRVYNMLTRGVYKKGFDVATKQFYYFNTKTKVAMWSKPKILGKHEPNLTPRTVAHAKSHGVVVHTHAKRYSASDLTKDEAAMIIQLMYRRGVARMHTIARAQQVYQKGYDPEADVFFYYNMRTGESQWHKPKFLHGADVDLTPRSFIGARRGGHHVQKQKKRSRFTAKDLSPDQASCYIQAWWRGHIGRRNIVYFVASKIYKGYDVDSQSFYWHNSNTGQSRWTRPWFLYNLPLDQGSLPLTARTAMLALEAKLGRLAKRKLRKKAHQMTRYEAAFMIQGMYRGWVARKRMRLLVRSLYEKLYDAERGTYYYFNKSTGSTSWYKPAILGTSDIRRSFVHTGSLTVQAAAKAAAKAARLAGYTMGEAALAMLDQDARGEYATPNTIVKEGKEETKAIH